MTDISEKLKVFIGDCNNRAGLRSRSQYAKAMWSTDEIDWPDGVQALNNSTKKEKQDDV